MKNRHRLMNMALVDMLYKANGEEKPHGNPYISCVVRNLGGKEPCGGRNCYECICEYLNKEGKR